MNPQDALALFAILLLTLLNAFFTLAETALVTVRNARLQQVLAEGGAPTGNADGVHDLMRQATRVGATVQVGITLASFAVAALAAATLGPDVARVFHRWGLPHETRLAGAALTLIAALLTIVVGEIVPRSVALRHPERVALAIQTPLRLCMVLF
nr:DUF21 domain-containing protein [Armatimonadota bacterium]